MVGMANALLKFTFVCILTWTIKVIYAYFRNLGKYKKPQQKQISPLCYTKRLSLLHFVHVCIDIQ